MREFEQAEKWDATASHYEQTAHPFTSLFAKAALARIPLTRQSHVLDIATGTGALALAAARTGAKIVATDFSPGMVARVEAAGIENIEARVMDGQALDLPDESFDAVFSIFGLIMFPDWRKGLSEMHRVTRPGGYGVIGSWQKRGAATFMLLGEIRQVLFPELPLAPMPEAMKVLSDAESFAQAFIDAGYRDPSIEHVTHDFELDVAALDRPDTLFGMSPDWTSLSEVQQGEVIARVREMAGHRSVLPIPSTALIGVARR